MNDLSRRQFISGVAKTCLGVSAIISAEDLIAAEAPRVIPKARHVIFLYMGGGMTRPMYGSGGSVAKGCGKVMSNRRKKTKVYYWLV